MPKQTKFCERGENHCYISGCEHEMSDTEVGNEPGFCYFISIFTHIFNSQFDAMFVIFEFRCMIKPIVLDQHLFQKGLNLKIQHSSAFMLQIVRRYVCHYMNGSYLHFIVSC